MEKNWPQIVRIYLSDYDVKSDEYITPHNHFSSQYGHGFVRFLSKNPYEFCKSLRSRLKMTNGSGRDGFVVVIVALFFGIRIQMYCSNSTQKSVIVINLLLMFMLAIK